ncbi:hypothetical protein O0I10_006007 [Lichtheimia ornata]|uniref:Methyltransferase domain-containing protein n=1 Tax=Lichtheimia ornata TaxID=688661 RepID=A0AAD7XV91_9FUNG|nr:uncharacterized protein O0I10_006007 [Lichtheimia ornata]KAJ8658324.1 hypothetical protein O0I10_006007 [Lichtheimia ornata]
MSFRFFRFFRRSRKTASASIRSKQPTEEITSKNSTNSSEASAYRYEGNRRYHNRDDVAYILPNDEEENDRVHQQHWMMRVAFGGNFDSPIEEALAQGIEVLDSGCGPATWTLEMSEQYPNSNFHGTDISPRFPEAIKPSNCQFHLHNIIDPAPFPDNTFGYVHQRLLVLGLLATDWVKVIDDLLRVLKPGGWLELLEVSFPQLMNAGPKCTLLMHSVAKYAREKGLNPDIPHEMEDLMRKAGCVNLVFREVPIPIGHGGKLGDLLWDDFWDVFNTMHAIIVRYYPEMADQEYYTKFLSETKQECKEHGTYIRWYRCHGQKPETA